MSSISIFVLLASLGLVGGASSLSLQQADAGQLDSVENRKVDYRFVGEETSIEFGSCLSIESVLQPPAALPSTLTEGAATDSRSSVQAEGLRVCGEETSSSKAQICLFPKGTAPRLVGEDVSAEGLSALEVIFSLDIAGYTLSIFLEG